MHNFKHLQIWRDGVELVDFVYRLTDGFPPTEKYGLSSQIQRAAVSIPSNIAEGTSRYNKEFAHFLSIAIGSLFELETQIIIARRRNYLDESTYILLTDKIHKLQKQVGKFRETLNSSNKLKDEIF